MKDSTKRKQKQHLPDEMELISNFMGLPASASTKVNRPPLSMDQLIEKAWDDWGIGKEESVESIISGNWQRIVGSSLAGKCAPINLSKDCRTLHVRCSASTIKQELSFKRSKILNALKKLRNCKGIMELRIY